MTKSYTGQPLRGYHDQDSPQVSSHGAPRPKSYLRSAPTGLHDQILPQVSPHGAPRPNPIPGQPLRGYHDHNSPQVIPHGASRPKPTPGQTPRPSPASPNNWRFQNITNIIAMIMFYDNNNYHIENNTRYNYNNASRPLTPPGVLRRLGRPGFAAPIFPVTFDLEPRRPTRLTPASPLTLAYY